MFWQRIQEERKDKKILADIEVSYTDDNGKVVEFTSAKEFNISYTEQYIANNPYVIYPLVLVLLVICIWIFFQFLFLLLAKKRRCPNCKIQVRKDWTVCPNCKHVLKKQKVKKKK